MSDYDYYSNLWKSISSKRSVTRKKVKFASVRAGRQFWTASRGGAAATKTANIKSGVPSGYTNARDGNFSFYVDPDKYVWIG